jgi:hypothetical protein
MPTIYIVICHDKVRDNRTIMSVWQDKAKAEAEVERLNQGLTIVKWKYHKRWYSTEKYNVIA